MLCEWRSARAPSMPRTASGFEAMYSSTDLKSVLAIVIPASDLSFCDTDCVSDKDRWPPLPLHEWQDTYRTLHMWTQIVGKVRMALSPPLNHWWHVTLYVNSRGLTTGPVPYPPGIFEIQFDFQRHEVQVSTSEGPSPLGRYAPSPWPVSTTACSRL